MSDEQTTPQIRTPEINEKTEDTQSAIDNLQDINLLYDSQPNTDESNLEDALPPKKNRIFPKITKEWVYNMLNTLQYSFVYISFGAILSALGWSNVLLAKRTNVSIEMMGIVFSCRGAGFVVGGIIIGKLLDIFKNNDVKWYQLTSHKIMAASTFMFGIYFILIPLITNFWFLSAVYFLIGISGGFMDAGLNTLVLWVWKENVNPYMQFLHFFFGIGAVGSPLIAGLVISEDINDTFGLKLSHWIITGVAWLSCIGYLLLKPPSPYEIESSTTQNPNAKWWKLSKETIISILMGLFLCVYVGAEGISLVKILILCFIVGYGGLIFDYVHEKKLAGLKEAAYLTSAFWVSLTVARLLAIPISSVVSPKTIVFLDVLGCFVSLGMILLYPNSMIFIWIATILMGAAMATQYPTIISFPATYFGMKTTGRMTSIMVVGASLGEMIIPTLITTLFSVLGPESLMWVLLAAFLFATSVFIFAITYYKRKKEPKEDDQTSFELKSAN